MNTRNVWVCVHLCLFICIRMYICGCVYEYPSQYVYVHLSIDAAAKQFRTDKVGFALRVEQDVMASLNLSPAMLRYEMYQLKKNQ